MYYLSADETGIKYWLDSNQITIDEFKKNASVTKVVTSVHTIKTHILDASAVCDQDVAAHYLKKHNRNLMFVAYEKQGAKSNVVSFVLANKLHDEIQIDVVCGRGNTFKLINYFIDYCKKTFDLHVFSLHALSSALTYYQKFGFKFRKDCTDSVTEIDSKLFQRVLDKSKGPKKYTLNKRLKSEDFRTFMYVLIHRNLTPETDISKAVVDGFQMYLCPNDAVTELADLTVFDEDRPMSIN